VDEAPIVGGEASEDREQDEAGLLVLVTAQRGGVATVASRLIVGGDRARVR
jgi:hypothetical protein